jgi:beta-glucosidase
MKHRTRGPIAAGIAALALAAGFGADPAAAHAGPPAPTPTPTCNGAPAPWLDKHRSPDERASLLLAQMTLDDKMLMLHAISDGTHARQVGPVPSLCVPALLLNNGSAGVSSGGVVQYPATALPAPIDAAAAWDPRMAARYGVVEGSDTLDQGRNLLEGPDVNIARVPLNGRTFEAYGEDPYLAGQTAVGDIDGIQSRGVIAEVKHLAANNQETNRTTVNELIDERTLHEIYLPAFQDAVQNGHAGSVMCAKNQVNSHYACESTDLLQTDLRQAWGFQGFVTSDFTSCHNTLNCVAAGMNIELPSATYYGDALAADVASGQVPTSTVDGLVSPVLRTMFAFGLFDRPQTTQPIDAAAEGRTARAASEAGTVLLKNSDSLLPLSTRGTRSIAVIGPGAGTAVTGGAGSPDVAPLYTVSPLDAITKRAGDKVQVNYAEGMPPVNLGQQPAIPSSALTPVGAAAGVHGLTAQYFPTADLTGTPAVTRVEPWIDTDYHAVAPVAGLPANTWSVRWTGTLTAPTTGDYTFSLNSHGGSTLYLDGVKQVTDSGAFPASTASVTVHLAAGEAHALQVDYKGTSTIELSWGMPAGAPNAEIDQAVAAAKASDVAVVFVGDKEAEGVDRTTLSLPGYQDELIEAVAAANPRTVVVLDTGAPVTMPWLDSVAGVYEAWYPGEEDGDAIAALLFGDADPGGRLPITFPKSLADTPADTPAQYPGVNGVAAYSEGVFVGYRHYDASGIAPLFPFGYGLSYTSFRLSRFSAPSRAKGPDDTVTVGVDVTNTGRRSGSEVVQLYVGHPADSAVPEPPNQLAGFQKVQLAPGQTKHVTLTLSAQSFAYWNTTTNAWTVQPGTYTVSVGTSSRDLPLVAHVKIGG